MRHKSFSSFVQSLTLYNHKWHLCTRLRLFRPSPTKLQKKVSQDRKQLEKETHKKKTWKMSAKSTATSRINLALHHYLCLSSNSNRSLHFHFHFHTIETTSCIYYLLDITIAAWQQSHNLLLCFLCKFTNVTLHISNCYLFLCRLLSGLMNELVRFALISVNTNR